MFVFPQFLFQNRYLIFSNYHNLVFSGLWYLQMSKPDVATGRPIRPSGSGSRVRPRGSGHVGLDTWVWPLGPVTCITGLPTNVSCQGAKKYTTEPIFYVLCGFKVLQTSMFWKKLGSLEN